MYWSGWQAPTTVVEKASLRRKHLSWVTRGTSHGKTGRRIFLAREVSAHRPKGGISFMCSGITRRLAWWVRWASEDGRGPLCRKLRAGGRELKGTLSWPTLWETHSLNFGGKTGWGGESGNEESRADAITAVPVGWSETVHRVDGHWSREDLNKERMEFIQWGWVVA